MTRCPIGFDAGTGYIEKDWSVWERSREAVLHLGGDVVRIGIVPWHCEQPELDYLVRVMQDCQAYGLKVMFTTAQLANNADQDTKTAIKVGSDYIKYLAKPFAQYVTWWQVLNEWDAGSWLNGENFGDIYHADEQKSYRRPKMTDEYLATGRDCIALARQYIKQYNPNCMVGTSCTGVAMDQGCVDYIWTPFYNVVAPAVDFIGINGYLMDWWLLYENAPGNIVTISQRFNLPVLITECGCPTPFTDDEARGMEYVAHHVLRLSRPSCVIGIAVYQLTDLGEKDEGAEANFGVLRKDGTMKTGAGTVRVSIVDINENSGHYWW